MLGDGFPTGDADLILTCARGTERALKFELRDLGYPKSQILKGAVAVTGPRSLIARANVYSRVSSRVLWRILDLEAPNEGALVKQLRDFPFEDLVDARRPIAMEAHVGQNVDWHHSRFAAQRLKDIVCDRLRDQGLGRPQVDVRKPYIKLVLHWEGQRAQISLDTTGRSLQKRGYRKDGGVAPMREHLAASILAIGHADVRRPFVDPMCGAGTLAIEQLLRSIKRYPGATREFSFARWRHVPRDMLEAVDAARDEAKANVLERPVAPIFASDDDPAQVDRCRTSLAFLGLEEHVQLDILDVGDIEPPDDAVIVMNPPFGERLSPGQTDALRTLYARMAKVAGSGHRMLVFSANPDTEEVMSKDLGSPKKWSLYSGPLNSTLLRWDI